MLWVLGVILALFGPTIYFLTVWKNYEGENRNWAIILGLIGFSGFVYLLVTLLIFESYTSDYLGPIILFFGIAVLSVNLGRIHVAPNSQK